MEGRRYSEREGKTTDGSDSETKGKDGVAPPVVGAVLQVGSRRSSSHREGSWWKNKDARNINIEQWNKGGGSED